MNTKLLTLSLISCALAACSGGSDGGSSKPGIKVNGISGINYQIGERSGVVTDGQAIPYSAGEQISFKLGELTLATVTAKDSITLADFFPALPTTAAEFRTQLRMGYDQSEKLLSLPNGLKEYSYGATPVLHRTSNLMQLLLAMDNDRNPDNGLDLASGNWASKLSGFNEDTLPLNIDLREFAKHYRTRAFSQVQTLLLAMDISAPLSTLYQVAGITIAAKAVTGYTQPNVTPGTVGEFVFNDNMQLESEKKITSNTVTTSYTYDSNGNITREFIETDLSNNGSIDSSREYSRTYSDFGASLTYDRKDRDLNGDLTRHDRTESVALDNKRQVARSVSTNQLDNTANYDVYLYEFNSDGLQTQQNYEEYDSSDTLLRELNQRNYSYADGKLSQAVSNSYSGSSFSSSTTQSYTYGDNTITVEGVYRNASNEVLGESYRYVENFSAGRLTKADYTMFSGDIGSTVNETKTIQYAYDDQGRLTSCTWYENDNPAPYQRNRFEYGPYGMTKKVVQETYNLENQSFQSGSEKAFTYGDSGELLTEPTNNNSFSYSSENVVNGVAYLIHEMKLLDQKSNRKNDSCYFFWF